MPTPAPPPSPEPLLKSRFWADLSTLDFAHLRGDATRLAQTVALLPVAAIEQHGPHLPLNVDTTLVEGVVAAALPLLAPELPLLVLPTQQIGKSNEHLRFPGTLSLGSHTLIDVWMELGAAVARAGLRKLLLFNAHGGQVSVMDLVARDLRERHDLIVYSASWYSLPLEQQVLDLFSPEEHRFGVHGGDMETSMMLALKPDLVDMAQARNFRSSAQDRARDYPILGNGRSAKLGWQMQDYNAMGAAGDAALATAAKGQALVQASARQLALLLAEISRLPLSTLVDQPQRPD